MNWVQYKDLLCYLCLCGLVVSPLSLTQEILDSANSVKTFRENSIDAGSFWFFTNTKLTMLTLLSILYYHFVAVFSLFASTDVRKCEIRMQGAYEDYISRLHILLDLFIFNGTAKMKLAMLEFLFCGEFVKNSIAARVTQDN